MGTGTLTSRSTGETITSSFFNDFNSALNETFVGRNSSGAATSGQPMGSAAIPWGAGYFNSLIVDGSALDTSQITSPANRIVSGATRSTSGQPQFIIPNGSALSLIIDGTPTNLVFDVNGAAVTCSTDITVTSLTAAPSSNNTCLVNDAAAADGNETRSWGEKLTTFNPRCWSDVDEYSSGNHKESITVDNMGSEITALVGKFAAFNINDGSNDEQFLGYVKSTTEITNCFRGCFTNSSGNPVNAVKFANNDTITLLKLTWVFLTNDGTTADVTYNNPVWSDDEPGSPTTGDYWFDLGVSEWKRYSGSAFVSINRTLIGIVISNTSATIGARSIDFWKNPKENNTVTLRAKSATNVIGDNLDASINVYGSDYYFKTYLPEWNITTDLATSVDMYNASEQASTWYYFYITETGDRKISDIAPVWRADLYGEYHPNNTWRCVGAQFNDGSSNLVNNIIPKKSGNFNIIPDIALNLGVKILQFATVTDTATSTFSGGSGTYTATGLRVSLTPRSTSSKILVLSNTYMSILDGADAGAIKHDLQRDIAGGGYSSICSIPGGPENYLSRNGSLTSIMHLDSPATTGAVTYQFVFSTNYGTSSTGYYNSISTGGTGSGSRIFLLELDY